MTSPEPLHTYTGHPSGLDGAWCSCEGSSEATCTATSPEPAVPDLREVAARAVAEDRANRWGYAATLDPPELDAFIARQVADFNVLLDVAVILAAVLPLHRGQVLDEAADHLAGLAFGALGDAGGGPVAVLGERADTVRSLAATTPATVCRCGHAFASHDAGECFDGEQCPCSWQEPAAKVPSGPRSSTESSETGSVVPEVGVAASDPPEADSGGRGISWAEAADIVQADAREMEARREALAERDAAAYAAVGLGDEPGRIADLAGTRIHLVSRETLRAAEAERDEAHSALVATRLLAAETMAALRTRILVALGLEDDGRTQMTEYVDALVAELDSARRRQIVVEDLQVDVEAERDRLAETVGQLQVERDDALALVAACTTTQQLRLAETVRRLEPVIEAAKAWRAEHRTLRGGATMHDAAVGLISAVDALSDAGPPHRCQVPGCPGHSSRLLFCGTTKAAPVLITGTGQSRDPHAPGLVREDEEGSDAGT